MRSGVQFHWLNPGYTDFEQFLATLEHKKRKNIRAERRKVREAGVTMRQVRGVDAVEADWKLFHRCYSNTYAEHRSSPYLSLDFFRRIGASMPENILLVIAEREGRAIAASLVIHTADTLYGRYWGALEHVPCLHFETAYYQPLEFCIANGIATFEGGPRASTRWRAASCRKRPGPPTGWRTRPLRTPYSASSSANGAASTPTSMN